jgi:hypothetical protein
MPANLPPQYFEVEKRYREAKTPEAKLEMLEEMLTIMPKHKGTDKLRADLRRRIAKLKSQSGQKKGAGRRDSAYAIEKEGAVQALILGPPNSGKSSLVAALTKASPEVADFPHSTWTPTAGMALYENIQFQLVDMPPLTRERMDPGMADLIRRTDMVVVLLDVHSGILQEYEDTLAILEEIRVFPQGCPAPAELARAPFFKRMLVAVNKVDSSEDAADYEVFLELAEVQLPCMDLSVRSGRHVDLFLRKIFETAAIVRVYSKAPGKEADLSSPFVLPRGSTLEDLAEKVHKDFVEKLKFARIWGKDVYDGQMVQRDYVLQDGDIVEMRI